MAVAAGVGAGAAGAGAGAGGPPPPPPPPAGGAVPAGVLVTSCLMYDISMAEIPGEDCHCIFNPH